VQLLTATAGSVFRSESISLKVTPATHCSIDCQAMATGSWDMKKILGVLVAAALSGATLVATSSSADARWGWGYGGWRGAWGYGGGWGYRGVGCCGGWGYRGLGWARAASRPAPSSAQRWPLPTITIRFRPIRPTTITLIRPPLTIIMAQGQAAATEGGRATHCD